MVRALHIGLVSLLLTGTASASEEVIPDRWERKPREMEGVGLSERLGQRIPLDVAMTDADGRQVTLRSIFDRGLPVVLTFNYSDCPVLCSTQLDMLAQALAKLPDAEGTLALRPGRHYQVVTISLDPTQTPEKSRRMRDGYVLRFPAEIREQVRTGWHFLTADEPTVRRMADSIGLSYRYLADRREYVHPAVVTFLSTEGLIVRYVKGLNYEPAILSESVWAAGTSSPRDSVGFILTCFHYDPEAGSYAGAGRKAMKYGAAGFVVALLIAFAVFHQVRARRGRKESSPA